MKLSWMRLTALGAAVLLLAACDAKTSDRPPAVSVAPSPLAWARLPDLPIPVHSAAAAVVGRKLYVVGGFTSIGHTDAVQVYDFRTHRWSRGPSFPRPIHEATAVSYRGHLVVLGGFTLLTPSLYGGETNEAWFLGKNSWGQMPAFRHARGGAVAAVVGNVIVLAAGQGDGLLRREPEIFNGVYWREGSLTTTHRSEAAGANDGRFLYVISGRTSVLEPPVERYDPAADLWERLPDIPTPRQGLGAAVVDNMLLVIGGRSRSGATGLVEALELQTGTWRRFRSMPVARQGVAVAKSGRFVYVAGGTASAQAFFRRETIAEARPSSDFFVFNAGRGRQISRQLPTRPAEAYTSRAKAVVYVMGPVHDEVTPPQSPGLWLFDPQSGETRKVATLPQNKYFSMPRFRTVREISVVIVTRGKNSFTRGMDLLDLRTGERRPLLKPSTTSLLDCSWRDDGEAIACIEADFHTDSVHKVVVHELDGTSKVIRRIGVPGGRDCCRDDEVSVRWSKDGRSLLVVDTHVDFAWTANGRDPHELDTVHVIDLNGRDLIHPLRGTQARWSPDEKFLYMREWSGARKAAHWFRLEIESGKRKTLQLRAAGYDVSLSPDGRYIAYQFDGNLSMLAPERDRNVLYVYDLEQDINRRIVNGFRTPIWLGPTVMAATKVDRCDPRSNRRCDIYGFAGRGAWRIPVSGGSLQRLSLGSTMFGNVDVLYE